MDERFARVYDGASGYTMERGERLKQLFRSNPLPLWIVIVILIGGLIVRIQLPITPFADGDSWGYLHPALSWLSGLGFQQTDGRDWLYPALLAGILKVADNFGAISCVQHFLGVAGILLFWLAWRSYRQLVPTPKPVWRWMYFVFALLLFAFYAWSPQQAILENTIRPEGMLAFFEMAYFCCLISFFSARWRLRRTGAAIAFGAGVLGLSYVILLLKPGWGFSFGFSLLSVGIGGFGKTTRLLRLGPFLTGAIAILFLFFLPRFLGFQKDAQLFLPFTLVSIHSAQILETSPSDASLNTNGSDAASPVLYEELTKVFGAAKENPGRYHSLGFDADYIQYRSGFFSIIKQNKGWSDSELAAACYSAYFRAWLHAPSSMVHKVWKQIRLFLFPRAGDFYSTAKSVDLNHEAIVSRHFLPDSSLSPHIENLYQSYRERLERMASNPSHPPGCPILAKLALLLAWISSWMQLAFFAAIAGISVSRRGRALLLAGLVVVAVLAAIYGNVLTIAVVHSLDVVRYRISYAPALLLGLALAINYLLSLASAYTNPGGSLRRSAAPELAPKLSSSTQSS
jgi:hypothetical protein